MEYGLIGERLGHSYSPWIHACFGDYDYRLYPMDLDALKETLQKRDFRGLNITIPYKKAVLPFCDEISDTVRQVGSANTLVMRGGKLYADNTDLPGFISMMEKGGISLTGKKVIILGSGGTSLTAQAACRALGAREWIVISRSGPVTYEDLYACHTDGEIIINTTPVGMYPGNLISPVDLSRFPHLSGVADVIYNPARTALILDAMERKIPCIDGLWMLVAQAWHAAKQFLGADLSKEKIQQAYQAVRGDCLNLVLVGMPGCGKSTLGKMAAEKLGKQFIDLDGEITKEHGPIPEIFEKQGEGAFREIEREMCARYGKEKGLVIATGGGVILKKENIRALSQNGIMAWVQRPLEALGTDGRPLSQGGIETLQKLWAVRKPLYQACADFTIENIGTPMEAAARIVEGFNEAAGD